MNVFERGRQCQNSCSEQDTKRERKRNIAEMGAKREQQKRIQFEFDISGYEFAHHISDFILFFFSTKKTLWWVPYFAMFFFFNMYICLYSRYTHVFECVAGFSFIALLCRALVFVLLVTFSMGFTGFITRYAKTFCGIPLSHSLSLFHSLFLVNFCCSHHAKLMFVCQLDSIPMIVLHTVQRRALSYTHTHNCTETFLNRIKLRNK